MFVGDGSHPLDRQFRVGKFFGIPLDLHIVLLIYAAFEVLASILTMNFVRLLSPVILFGSVYLHELGHALSSAHFGARPRRIVLHLFGGVAEVPGGLTTKQQMWVIAWGPIVSGILAVIGIVFGIVFALIPIVGALFWWMGFINLILFIFNVLPIFPLDGGQFVRQWVTLRSGSREAIRKTLPWSMTILIVLGMLGLIFTWIGPLAFIIALFLLFIHYQEVKRHQHLFTGPKGFWGHLLPGKSGGGFGRLSDQFFVWSNRSKAEELMRRTDEIGIHALKPHERQLLEKYLDAKFRLRGDA